MASFPKTPLLTGLHSPESLFGAKATQILEHKIGLLTQPSLIDQMVQKRLRGEGYEILGEIPKERPPEQEPTQAWKPGWNPLAHTEQFTDDQGNVDYDRLWSAMTQKPEERAVVEKFTTPGPDVPTPEARPPLKSDERDYIPSAPFWRQVRDLSLLAAKRDPNYFMLSATQLADGMSLNNFKHLMGVVERVSGKPGLYEKFKADRAKGIKDRLGYYPEKAMAISGGIHNVAGALAPYSLILKGAGRVTAGASNIPTLQRIARATVGGALTGLLRAPEEEGALNRIQQIPGDVLFFTALEMGALTFSQAKKIHDWNKQFKGKRPDVRARVVSTEIGGEPPETRRLTLDELKKLFNRMQARAAGRTEYQGESLNWQQWEEDLAESLKGIPGWRQVFRGGYRPSATIPGKPGAGFHTYALERDWLPRKPKMGDVFKRMEKHTVFDEMGREVVKEWDVPKGESPYERIHPEKDPYSSFIGDRGAPRAEVPPTEAPPTAEPPPPRGEQPRVSGPVVLVDVKPKRGGGWEYEFKIPTEQRGAAAAAKVIDFTPTAELPPHLKERVVPPPKPPKGKRRPKGWANPLYQDIFDYGKIAPSKDYPHLHRIFPPGLVSKSGHKPDVLAQELSHKYPGIESADDLVEMGEAILAGKAKFRNRETGEEFEPDPAEEEYYEAQAEEFLAGEEEREPLVQKYSPEVEGELERRGYRIVSEKRNKHGKLLYTIIRAPESGEPPGKIDEVGGGAHGAYVRQDRLTPQEYGERKALQPRYEEFLKEYFEKKYAEAPPEKRWELETDKVLVFPPETPGGPPTVYALDAIPEASWEDVKNHHRASLPEGDLSKHEAYLFTKTNEVDPSKKRYQLYTREEADRGLFENDFLPRGEEPFYVTPEGQAIPESKFRVIKALDRITAAAGRGKSFKYKDLFGKEVKIVSEKQPKKIKIDQPKLFEMEERPGKYPAPFDNRGLAKFSDVNKFRKAVQPALDEGHLVEYGHKAGAEGWAKITGKRDPGKGKLMSVGVKRPEMGELREKPAPTLEEPPLKAEEKPAFNRDLAIPEIERVVRARWPSKRKSEVDDIVNDVATGLLKTFDPKRAKLNTAVTDILKKRYRPDGTIKDQHKLVPWEEQKEYVKAGKPKPTKTPEALFEQRQTVERARKLFKEVAENKKRDPKILEDYILDEKTQEAIAKEQGLSVSRVNAILLDGVEKMKSDPDMIRLLRERHIKMNLGPMPSEKDLRRLAGWMSRYFSSRKGASYEVDLENDKRISGYLSEIYLATLEARDLIKAVKKFRSEAVDRLIFDVLRGHTPIEATTLPDNVAAILNQMRQRIDMLSMQIVAHGGLAEQTKTGIMNNIGKYVRQMYKLHNSKHWDPPEEARQALIDKMKADDPDRYGHMTNDEVNEILNRIIEQERGGSSFGVKAKQKKIDTDSYIRRKDLSEEWKNFAGPVEDPYYIYVQTVSKQVTMGHNAKFLNAIKQELPDLWATTVAGDARRERWPRLPDTYGYGELAGKFVDPELEKYIMHEVEPEVDAIVKAFQDIIVNPFKATKTLGSVPTHARNLGGNTMFSLIMRNLILNPINAPYYADALKTFTLRRKSRRLEWAGLVKAGVTETQFYGADVPKLYNDLMRLDPASWPKRIIKATAGKTIEKAGELYNFEDALYRIAAHYKNTRHFGMSPEESVKEINLGMTNYRKLPVMVDILRKWPLFGPFISFKWNVAKIIANQFRQAGREMAKPGTRGKGTYRLLRIILALSIPTLLSEFSKRIFDIDDEKIKELERHYLDYRRHGIFVYFPWKGTLKTLDMSYIYPTGEFEKVIRATVGSMLRRGKVDWKAFAEGADIMAHPVFDTWSILVEGRYPGYAGKVPGGLAGRAAEAAKLLWIPASAPIPSFKGLSQALKEGTFKPKEHIRPGALTPHQIETILRAWNQESDAWGRTRSFPEEVKNFFTGLRTWDVDPQKELARYMRGKQREARDIMINAGSWSKRNTKAPGWEQINKAAETLKQLKPIAEDVHSAGELWQKLQKSGWTLFKHEAKPGVTKTKVRWEEKPKAINWKKILEEYN